MVFNTKYLLLLYLALAGCVFNSTDTDDHCGIRVEGDSKSCFRYRPCEITPISKDSIPNVGFNNWVKKNTPDSLVSFIDSSFFTFELNKFSGHLPLKYPYYLDYSVDLDYFLLFVGDCEFTSLPQIDLRYTFDEIFQIAISDNHMFMATYDDDLSFMDPKKLGIKYHITDLDFKNVVHYTNKPDFMNAIDSITQSSFSTIFQDEYFSAKDFVDWYKSYEF